MFESYRAVENQEMPVGLYVWQGRLFLLVKSAADVSSGTAWHLVELSVGGGTVVKDTVVKDTAVKNSVELPTTAADITVVPGPEYFAVIEKGKIETLDLRFRRILYRSTQSALLVPASWLVETGTVRKSREVCRRIIGEFEWQ